MVILLLKIKYSDFLRKELHTSPQITQSANPDDGPIQTGCTAAAPHRSKSPLQLVDNMARGDWVGPFELRELPSCREQTGNVYSKFGREKA
ncbi:hypothetical protein WR25_00966 [Diploscapter pachys]|uniref:Uncharacterized protein n=1 Tax=Diploscapter pachys TaxID=2018661 RepID=A0A2A2JW26_9BILA|nr:hypothetical protein WR25_00966 [Diploscapter pachys]